MVPDFAKEVGSYSNFKKIDLTKIEVEKGYNDIKPDIIAWVGDENNFFVEIAVTHKVDYEKQKKIKEVKRERKKENRERKHREKN